jgi:hypothetical protein
MAKRSRLAGRPGQRRPLQRIASRPASAVPVAPAAPPPSTSITPEEEARAAEIEAQIVAEEKAATDARDARDRVRKADLERVSYGPGSIAARAQDEYKYVQRDLRRIALVGGFLIAILVVLEILVNALHLFTL